MNTNKAERVRYRIYTEDMHPTDDRRDGVGVTPDVLMSAGFSEYTRFEGQGCWDGETENSIVFEVIGHTDLLCSVHRTADSIRRRCGQAAVLVTAEPVTQYLLTGE